MVTSPKVGMVNWLLQPLSFEFMQRGLLIAMIVGIVCALVGCYIVLRGMAFFGDALAHAILPGLAVGYLASAGDRGALFWWALVTAIITSVGIGALSRGVRIRQDTAIGIVFAGMFALGIALISSVRNYAIDLTHFLFGNVLGVTQTDLWLTAGVGVAVILAIYVFYKEFLVLSFDTTLVTTLRLPARTLEVLLSILMAVAIVVSLQTVGVALVVALLVTPAAAASLITRNLRSMMFAASVIAAGSGAVGLYASFYLNIASGAAIVLTCTLAFLIIWFWKSIFRRSQMEVR